ncbi:HBR180Wp [Eremothecium sinecaudum]|uniref:HBR180Wp n=1 Tax=Eremothecium sinecaudum TaxID=45286 RepID=A0A120K182_9SACH|nr:HBR180Wp [Eremothecium sinecaudum]AMD19081.1 HBR180Wp [Eremothecium sinecaudum]
MSAAEYYGSSDNKQTYQPNDAPPPNAGYVQPPYQGDSKGYGYQDPPYYQQSHQGYYQGGAPPPPGGGYYGGNPYQQNPVYVQQQPQSNSYNSCLGACLAGMCLCCTLDMLF